MAGHTAQAVPLIRRALPADASALAEFAERTFRDTFGADNRPDDLAAYLTTAYGPEQQAAELANPDIVTLLAESGREIVAFAQLRREAPPIDLAGEAPLQLWRFYVEQRRHGSGLAHRFIAAVYDAASQMGSRTLWLTVWERNPRAIAFYAKCGFRDVGATEFLVGADRQTDRVMVREERR